MVPDGKGVLMDSFESQTFVAPSSGDGSLGSPNQIHSVDHLYWIASDPPRWDKAYLQVANIDASETSSWYDGDGGDPEGFIPIGATINKVLVWYLEHFIFLKPLNGLFYSLLYGGELDF